MDLLKVALLIVLLTAASAAPRGFRRHHDADIPEQKLLDAYHRFISDTSIFSDSSQSDSSQSDSSDSSESSERVIIPDVTEPPVTTTRAATTRAATSPAMTTVEEGSSGTPEVGTMGTDQPIVMETTLAPETPTPSDNLTTACDQCFTVVIPTAAPITDNRGDN